MKKFDFHLHSHYSDGEHDLNFILREAKKNGIAGFSIVDHNYIYEGIKDFKNRVNQEGINFLEGIEVSCIDKKRGISIHMLGYSNNFDVKTINKDLQLIIDGYNTRAKNIISKINNELPGINLDFDKIHASNNERYTSRNTLAREVSRFLNNSLPIKEILKKYVFVPEDDSWMFSPHEVISIIKKNNGKAFIAHSGRIYSKIGKDEYVKFIKELREAGMEGIEVYYPSHTEDQFNVLNDIAQNNNLMMSGGSDWHGYTYTPQTTIGSSLPEINAELMLKV